MFNLIAALNNAALKLNFMYRIGNYVMKTQFKTPLKPSELAIAMNLAHKANRSLMVWGAPGIGKSDLARQFADYRFPLKSKVRTEAEVQIEQQVIDAIDAEIASQSTAEGTESTKRAKPRKAAAVETKFPLLDQKTNIVDLRLAQVEPTDLRGIPVPIKFYVDKDGEFVTDAEISKMVSEGKDVSSYTQKNQVVWAPPALLDLPRDWQGVIFLDEANQAMPVVQAAAYQLFLDKRIGDLILPEKSFILAAGNREGDGGVTFKLALPLRDRMSHVELKADFEEWKSNYAIRRQVHPLVVGYLATNTKDFNTLSTEEKNICGGSSPRSWVTVSDYIYEAEAEGMDRQQRRVLWAMVEGTVGDDITGRFKTFYDNVAKLPATMDILEGKVKNLDAYKNEMDVSKSFTVCLNLAYKIISENEDVKSGGLVDSILHAHYNNMLQFLHNSFKEEPELIMMAMKTMYMQKIYMAPAKIPYFKEFCSHYSRLLFKSREQAYS